MSRCIYRALEAACVEFHGLSWVEPSVDSGAETVAGGHLNPSVDAMIAPLVSASAKTEAPRHLAARLTSVARLNGPKSRSAVEAPARKRHQPAAPSPRSSWILARIARERPSPPPSAEVIDLSAVRAARSHAGGSIAARSVLGT